MFSFFKKEKPRRNFIITAQISHRDPKKQYSSQMFTSSAHIETPAEFCPQSHLVEDFTSIFRKSFPENIIDNVAIIAICEMKKADIDKFFSKI